MEYKREMLAETETAMLALNRLRRALADSGDPKTPEECYIDGRTYGTPQLGVIHLLLTFGSGGIFSLWLFNIWKFSFAFHWPQRLEPNPADLALWLEHDKERRYQEKLDELIQFGKRTEAVTFMRFHKGVSSLQAMQQVDQLISNKIIALKHLPKLDGNVKVNDRIVQEYKEMGGDMTLPLQARQ